MLHFIYTIQRYYFCSHKRWKKLFRNILLQLIVSYEEEGPDTAISKQKHVSLR